MRVALLQLTASDDPASNLVETQRLIAEAAGSGARLVLTPEVTNCVSADRARQKQVLSTEAKDVTLLGLRRQAKDSGIWILVGSLALKAGDPDGRFVNRSFLISPTGEIAARYDKIHMFDVQVSETETYRESAGYRPGSTAVIAETELGAIGMTICYDVRFPTLYRALARAGASMIAVPSAFSPVTGAAHWHSLLRARAIETGCYVLAPAQTGTHEATAGRARTTYGHSLVVSPWGDVLADGGTKTGLITADLDMAEVLKARSRIPSLEADVHFGGPDAG